jgi:hypothetical protein
VIEAEEFKREDAFLGVLSDIKSMLAPFGRIVAFVVEGSLEDQAYAVAADLILVDVGHVSERVCLQTNTALAVKAVHVGRAVHVERAYVGRESVLI